MKYLAMVVAIGVWMVIGVLVFLAIREALHRWKSRPAPLSPTLDPHELDPYEADVIDCLRGIRQAVMAIAEAPASSKPIIAVLEKILTEVTRSVPQMEIDHERDGHIRQLAEHLLGPYEGAPVVARIDALQIALQKQHHAQIQALDALVLEFVKFAKQQQSFMHTLFNGGSISTSDDASAAQAEKVQMLMTRYGISYDAAKERVMGSAVYEPNTGRGTMGGQA